MSKDKNISKFDELFKEGLGNHIAPAPAPNFIGSGVKVAGAASKSIIGIKSILIVGISSIVGLGAYYWIESEENTNTPSSSIENERFEEELQDKIDQLVDNSTLYDDSDNESSTIVNRNLDEASTISSLQLGSKESPINNESLIDDQTLNIDQTINKSVDQKTEKERDLQTVNKQETPLMKEDLYINLKGNVCNGSAFVLRIDGYQGNGLTWIINDDKLKVKNDLIYQFSDKIPYQISAYSEGQKIADTFIDMSAISAVVHKDYLSNGVAQLQVRSSSILNGGWYYLGQLISSSDRFVYSERDYTTTPFFIAKNQQGCSDTFRADKGKAHFKFITQVLTPNNDGYNDTYEVDALGCEYFNVIIRNSRNEIVFSSNSPYFVWDGKNQLTGKQSLMGWYSVQCTYRLRGEVSNSTRYDKVWIR